MHAVSICEACKVLMLILCMHACLVCFSLCRQNRPVCTNHVATVSPCMPLCHAICICSCFKSVDMMHNIGRTGAYTGANSKPYQPHQNCVHCRTLALNLFPQLPLPAQLLQSQLLKLTPQPSASPPTSPPNSAPLCLLPRQPHRQTHRQTKKKKRQKHLI